MKGDRAALKLADDTVREIFDHGLKLPDVVFCRNVDRYVGQFRQIGRRVWLQDDFIPIVTPSAQLRTFLAVLST